MLNARDVSLCSRHLAQHHIADHPGVSVPLSKTGSMGYQQRFLTALHDIHFRCVLVSLENGCSPQFLVALCSESSVSFRVAAPLGRMRR